MMNYRKMQASNGNLSTWDHFLEMVRKTDSHRAYSNLEFYTRSAMPALLALQSNAKQEQL